MSPPLISHVVYVRMWRWMLCVYVCVGNDVLRAENEQEASKAGEKE